MKDKSHGKGGRHEEEELEAAVEEAQVVDDIEETPEGEIERLTAELDERIRECEEHKSNYLRARADLDNYRKRAEKEKTDFAAYANEKLMTELLPVIDNFERALAHAGDEGKNAESITAGVKLIMDQLKGVLVKAGLAEVGAAGERFDPNIHHAISHASKPGAEPGTIVEEFQKGYMLKGRLLRPAMVSVAGDGGEDSGGGEGLH